MQLQFKEESASFHFLFQIFVLCLLLSSLLYQEGHLHDKWRNDRGQFFISMSMCVRCALFNMDYVPSMIYFTVRVG